MVDQQLQSNSDAILRASSRIELLKEAKNALQAWVVDADALPQDQPLTPTQRSRILFMTTISAQFTPAWIALLEKQPTEIAGPPEYLVWIEEIFIYIEEEVPLLEKSISQLEMDRQGLSDAYAIQAQMSLGISPNLTIEGFEEIPPQQLHSTGLWILIGSIVALFIWVLTQLIRITKRSATY